MSGLLAAAYVCVGAAGLIASTDESRSAPLARELTALMGAQNLTTFAASNADAPDTFVAVMVFPGVQLLTVSGRPSAPAAAQLQLDQRQYADVYMTLQQAVVPESKVFVQDLKGDGLQARAADAADIVYDQVVNQTIFDGAPAKHKLTDQQYAASFAAADARYSRLLAILVEALKQRAVVVRPD